ncbi:MAG TPA: aspartate racemase [Clostridiales bacterium]|nr:aspartate racemase [Clostridiales bacterium]
MFDGKLGILGGMGPQATQLFYQYILDRTPAARDQDHLPTVILSDTGMPDRTAAILSGHTEPLYQRLLADVLQLCQCGCTAIAIPCNTSHYFVPRLQQEAPVPVLNMIEQTAAALARQGLRRPGILATDGTIRTGLYQQACAALGLEAVAPDGDTQRLVMSLIYDQIKQGQRGCPHTFAAIDAAIRAAGCDCAILACTELSVFASHHPLPPFYLDAMAVLADCALSACGKI